ncbi:MAG TPA: C-terminal binding protein [Terriglobia bacterium]|nr:C-terminal binding protein [Terriglobia bacterium]
MSAEISRLVVFTEREEGPVCGLDAKVIHDAGGDLRYGRAGSLTDRVALAQSAEVLIASTAPMGREFLDQLPQLKGIVRLGIGVDSVDLDAATDLGIVVANVPEFCQDEVAEHALGLLLAVTRKIALADRLTRQGKWVVGIQESMLPIRRLRGQTLGLVGFGRIAHRFTGMAKALGLRVIAADPYAVPEVAQAAGVTLMPLEELLPQADIVSLHVPLTSETRCLINSDAFALMKRGAILINTARGPVVDEVALEEALADGDLGGAGLDVLETEPPRIPHPLLEFNNVVVTCHYASCSLEAYADLRRSVSEQAAQILRGEFPRHLVNTRVKDSPQCRLRKTAAQADNAEGQSPAFK